MTAEAQRFANLQDVPAAGDGYWRRVAGAYSFVAAPVPAAHKVSHSINGSDALSPADIGVATMGAVCFMWDGAWSEVYTLAHPQAVARGQRHTVYMVSDWLDTGGKLTSAQLLTMFQAGHEIGSHGKTNVAMTGLSAANRLIEWDTSRTAIEAIIGAGNCRHWSYPQALLNATCEVEGYLRYRTQRSFAEGVTGSGRAVLPRGGFPYMTILAMPWKNTNQDEVLAWIRHAASTPVIFLVRAGTIDAAQPTSGPSPAQLTEALDLVQSLRVPAITVDEAFGNPLWHPNLGFENGTVGWYSPGGTATITTETDTPDTNLTGTKSLKISCDGAKTTTYLSARGPIWAFGQLHTLSFRYRIVDRGGTGNIIASAYGVDRPDTQFNLANTAALTSTTWVQATVDFTPSTQARQLGLHFTMPGTRNADLYADHVHIGPKAYGVFG